MRKDSKNGDGFYQRQTSVDKHNDCCIVMQPPIKTNEILDKQEEFIEEVHRENDMLRKVVSLLQQVLDNIFLLLHLLQLLSFYFAIVYFHV